MISDSQSGSQGELGETREVSVVCTVGPSSPPSHSGNYWHKHRWAAAAQATAEQQLPVITGQNKTQQASLTGAW